MKAVEGWEDKKLSDLAEYINGYAFKPDDWEKDGLPIIRIEQLKNPNAPTDCYLGRLHVKNIIDNGDLIFSLGIDKIFLKLFIEFYLPELTKASHVSTMQHITRKELDRFGAPFPTSRAEQTKIAEILSTVDRAIEQTAALIAKQQRIKTGLMQDLLTRGIDEHGTLRSEKTHKFKDSPVGRIPVEWEARTIGELTVHVGSGITPRGGESVYTREGILFIRSQNVHFGGLLLTEVSYIPQEIHDSMQRSEVFENDVLLNITGASIGRCCPMPALNYSANVNQHVCAIRLNQSTQWNADFLTSVIESSIGQNQILQFNAGGNREGLNYQQVKSFMIPWPKTDERQRSHGIIKGSGEALKVYGRNLEKLRSLKTALMQDLLTGKKRVTSLLEEAEKSAA